MPRRKSVPSDSTEARKGLLFIPPNVTNKPIYFNKIQIINVMEDNILQQLNPGRGDWIFSLIVHLQTRGLIILIFFALGLGFFPVLVALFEHNFFHNTNDKIVSVLEDFGNMSLYIIGLIALVLIANLYFGRFSEVFNKLEKNGVIRNFSNNKNEFIKKANSIFSKWGYSKLPYIMSILISIFVFISFSISHNNLWYSYKLNGSVTIASFAMIPVVAVTFYLLCAISFRIIAAYFVLKLLFHRNEIEIQPLHPDNCGGLSPLGKLSQSLNIGLFLWGGIVFLNVYQHVAGFYSDQTNYFIVYLIIVSYVIGAYIAFFVPLNAVHKSMKKAKDDAILDINHSFFMINQKINKDIKDEKLIDNEEIKNLENLKVLYDITVKMPVYPYNFKIVASFFSSLLIPLLLSFVSILIENILK